jgi:hypothetical protein
MTMKAPDGLRVLALLDGLSGRYGPQAFGQVMQRILAAAFERAGYQVTMNAVGVPDFTAARPSREAGYGVEVKTAAGGKVSLSRRDLDGVMNSGRAPVIAVLDYPSSDPRWVFLDARALQPGGFEIFRLSRKPQVDLDFDADLLFRSILAECHEAAMKGRGALEAALKNAGRWGSMTSALNKITNNIPKENKTGRRDAGGEFSDE